MTGFLLKKFLYDLWDNFFFIIALNIGFLLFLALIFLLLPVLPATGIILFFVLIYLLFVYLCTASSVLKDVSDYNRPNPMDLLINLKGSFLPAVVLFTVSVFVFCVLYFGVPFYLEVGGLAGLAAAFFSCWICFFVLGAIQFYPTVYFRLGMNPMKCLKKCAIILFDNTGFCLFVLLINTFLTILTLPFPGCPLLFLDEALRLRLLKYDWLDARTAEQNNNSYEPGWRRIKIPWKELLDEEKEKTGKRTWKAFIFPWKE